MELELVRAADAGERIGSGEPVFAEERDELPATVVERRGRTETDLQDVTGAAPDRSERCGDRLALTQVRHLEIRGRSTDAGEEVPELALG